MINKTKEIYSLKGKRVFVAGHQGMLGSAVIRRLVEENCAQILTVTKSQVDLRDKAAIETWMLANSPDVVFLCAAKVGGILVNDTYPVDFLSDNLAISLNVINAAYACAIEKLVFLGSSCIYPKYSTQPIDERELLTGDLEPTNQWYAIAKIAGIKLCQAYRKQYQSDFIVAMPTSLYGPGDSFNPASSHVIPALMHKIYLAKNGLSSEFVVWGTGKPRREFLHVDDCADALIFLMKNYSDSLPINIGYGVDISIAELAEIIKACADYSGKIEFDTSKPDGTIRKLLSSQRLSSMGWTPKISIAEGISETYKWFLKMKSGTTNVG